MEGQCCHKTTERSEDERKKLIARLNRIEGQIRGLKNMVESDAYCNDILTQAAAATSALNGFSKEVLSRHMHTCVAQDIRQGNDEVIDELMDTLLKLMR
jgi:DNA-binding FrmR family transcriptional regulator